MLKLEFASFQSSENRLAVASDKNLIEILARIAILDMKNIKKSANLLAN